MPFSDKSRSACGRLGYIVTATVRTPAGTILGLIYNPNFRLG